MRAFVALSVLCFGCSAASGEVILFDNSSGLPVWEANGLGFDPPLTPLSRKLRSTRDTLLTARFLAAAPGTLGLTASTLETRS